MTVARRRSEEGKSVSTKSISIYNELYFNGYQCFRGDEIAKRIKFMELNCVPKLEILLERIQKKLYQEVDTSDYLPRCQRDISRLLSSLRIAEAKYSTYDDKKVWNLEYRCRLYLDNPVLSAALTAKRQVADVNQGQSSVYPSLMLPPQTPWAMHRTNSSVHNAVYTDTVYYPNQKTYPPPRNAQYGLNTSSYAADSSIMGVPTGTQDYSGYASYSTYDDPYGYGTIGYQDNYVYTQQGNQPYTPQLGGSQNSGYPYQPLTSSQNSGSYSSIYHDTGDYQTSGGLVSTAYGSQLTQADLWNDGSSYAGYPSPHYSEYTPAYSSNAQSSSNQTSSVVTCAPGTENKSTTRAATRASQTTNRHILNHFATPFVLPDVLGVLPTQQLPVTTSWKFMPTPSNRTNTTSWRPGPTSSSTPSWTRPELTVSSATSWRPEPTSTSRISWRPEPISSGLPTVQQTSQVTGGTYGCYQRQGPAAFQNYGVSTPSLFQMPLDLNPVPYEVSHDIQQTAFSQGPTSCFPATHPGARTYASGLQSGSSMDTRRADELQITTNASTPPFLVDDQVEQEEEALSEHDHKRSKIE